jgi:hypothetical protein
VTPLLEDRSLEVWIGVDASVKRDSTALCICSYDGQAVRLVGHRIWQPSSEEPLDFEGTIEHELLELRLRFDIREVLYDPDTDAGFGAASQTRRSADGRVSADGSVSRHNAVAVGLRVGPPLVM